jgi:hypothetical protein
MFHPLLDTLARLRHVPATEADRVRAFAERLTEEERLALAAELEDIDAKLEEADRAGRSLVLELEEFVGTWERRATHAALEDAEAQSVAVDAQHLSTLFPDTPAA